MYIGQFGIALAGKGVHPQVPLWVLITAAFALDLISTTLALAGVEGLALTWAESGAGALVVAGLVGALYYTLAPTGNRRRRDRRGAVTVTVVAALHLPADLAANKLPLWPGGPQAGAALYEHPVADFAVEGAVVVVGWLLYCRSFPFEGRRWPAWVALGMLLTLQGLFSFGFQFW